MEPIQAERTAQEKLIELSEKLANHNKTHGRNVVFWSCKRCNGLPCCEDKAWPLKYCNPSPK